MKIVVAGGTGFIGRRLVRALDARGDEVVVLTRNAANKSDSSARVRFAAPADDKLLAAEVDGAEAIVGLAGAGVMDERWSEDRLREIRDSRLKSTSSLARAALTCKVRTFVSASAVGLYGMRKDDTIIEDETNRSSSIKIRGTDVLAKLCEAWESAADPARNGGVRVTHPRIGIVLGADGGALKSMVPPFKAFVGGPIGSGKQWLSWIHIDDAVRALLFAIDEAKLTGAYNCTAPHPARMDTFAKQLGVALDKPAIFRAPELAVRLALGERANVILSGQRATPTKLLSLGFSFRFPELADALFDIFPADAA